MNYDLLRQIKENNNIRKRKIKKIFRDLFITLACAFILILCMLIISLIK